MPLTRKPAKADQAAQSTAAADVLRALRSTNKEERWAAARRAADVPGAESALATALRDEIDPRIREAMFTSLARVGSPAASDALLEFLRSDDAGLRAGALDVLRSMVETVRAHLPGLLNDDDVDVRLLSCDLARSLPSKEATRMLCEVLARETEVNVCAAAIDVLAETGDFEALRALDECETRFKGTPFLGFAVEVAKKRIQSQSTPRHD